MKRFIEGVDRNQSTSFQERLEDFIAEDNPVRVIDAFVDELDLRELGFEGSYIDMDWFEYLNMVLKIPTVSGVLVQG